MTQRNLEISEVDEDELLACVQVSQKMISAFIYAIDGIHFSYKSHFLSEETTEMGFFDTFYVHLSFGTVYLTKVKTLLLTLYSEICQLTDQIWWYFPGLEKPMCNFGFYFKDWRLCKPQTCKYMIYWLSDLSVLSKCNRESFSG